ncbi:MAG: sigma-70 family RNA polymerase sigma factor [Planctomycetes bacterium]|nr:sigma-70 family RNA polymerase sigma factor [Planctomycetota bacterium]
MSDKPTHSCQPPRSSQQPTPQVDITRQLLEQVRDSGTHAERGWFDLLARCESRLRTLLHFRLPDAVRATIDEDDLLQEVWIGAAHKIHEFEYRGSGTLQRWLASILRNKLLHAGRKAKRLPFPEAAMSGSANSEQIGLFEALSRSQPGVSHDERRRETEKQVRGVLYELPPELREAILLKVYEGLSGKEAAHQLGITEGAFSKRFHKALDRVSIKLRQRP